MSFRVSDFRAEMEGDGARPNLFEVTLPFPPESIPAGADRKLTFFARAAQLPGRTSGFVTQYYFGREVKFAGNPSYPDWTITVVNDEDFKVRNAFERWMEGINTSAGNIRIPSSLTPTSYTRDVNVTQFSKVANRRIKSYSMVGAFPVDVSPVDLDWGANDAIEEFTVTFQYQYWLSNTTDVPPAGLSSVGLL